MFSFLNRNKSAAPASTNHAADVHVANGQQTLVAARDASGLEAQLADAQKNLYDAIMLRRIDIVVSLINEWFKAFGGAADNVKYFFNSNYCDASTTSPLMLAYSLKERDLVRALLNFGADPSLVDHKTNKCLTQAIIDDMKDSAEPTLAIAMLQVLSEGFMQAIVQDNMHALHQYLQSGFQVNTRDSNDIVLPDEHSYLHWAVLYASEPVVRLLLDHGADVNHTNKFGATPLHECIKRGSSGPKDIDETLRIAETLLVHKADVTGIKGSGGVFKDLSALEFAIERAKTHPELNSTLNFMKEFIHDVSQSSVSSVPASPTVPVSPKTPQPQVSNFATPTTPASTKEHAHNDSLNNSTHSDDSVFTPNGFTKPIRAEFEELQGWGVNEANAPPTDAAHLTSLLWPQPQLCTILSENEQERFSLANIRTHAVFVYIKPPYTYAYMDFIHKLANSFSALTFTCINKPIADPYISVNIDKDLFQNENAYSILVTRYKIEINAVDSTALQYAFFTLMQLCKLYAQSNIPSLRIIDYSDVKYRSVLLDFSQGFYLKFDSLLTLLQMLAFYKINQVHFYVKFSSLPPMCDKRQWYHMMENHWFGLMKFCEDVHLQIVPSIDISNDVAELCDVLTPIKEYLDLFKGFKFLNIGPRLSSLLTCMDNKNPFSLDSNQYMMLCSYLYHNADEETSAELEKFDKYILMEYGLKVGNDFKSKSTSLYKSGQPFYFCVGSANWNSLLGCPDGSLYNIFDALELQPVDRPLGMLLCNFSGAANRTPLAFSLNPMVMFAGCTWNSKLRLDAVQRSFAGVIKAHGLINDRDGDIGIVMLELGHLETYLSRKLTNSKGFLDLPYDAGSIFVRILNDPDNIDLDYLDKNVFKKALFQLRKQHSKLKSILLNTQVNPIFKEVAISVEVSLHLFKFLITMFNAGTRQMHTSKSTGLSVINIGVSNLNRAIRTDLANRLLILKEEYHRPLETCYHEGSFEDSLAHYYNNLIKKLLVDDSANTQGDLELANLKLNDDTKMNSVSRSNSVQSSYFASGTQVV